MKRFTDWLCWQLGIGWRCENLFHEFARLLKLLVVRCLRPVPHGRGAAVGFGGHEGCDVAPQFMEIAFARFGIIAELAIVRRHFVLFGIVFPETPQQCRRLRRGVRGGGLVIFLLHNSVLLGIGPQ